MICALGVRTESSSASGTKDSNLFSNILFEDQTVEKTLVRVAQQKIVVIPAVLPRQIVQSRGNRRLYVHRILTAH